MPRSARRSRGNPGWCVCTCGRTDGKGMARARAGVTNAASLQTSQLPLQLAVIHPIWLPLCLRRLAQRLSVRTRTRNDPNRHDLHQPLPAPLCCWQLHAFLTHHMSLMVPTHNGSSKSVVLGVWRFCRTNGPGTVPGSGNAINMAANESNKLSRFMIPRPDHDAIAQDQQAGSPTGQDPTGCNLKMV